MPLPSEYPQLRRGLEFLGKNLGITQGLKQSHQPCPLVRPRYPDGPNKKYRYANYYTDGSVIHQSNVVYPAHDLARERIR